MSGKVYNVGIIGYGLSTKVFQIPLILATKSLKLHAIVQRTPKPSDDAALDYPDLKIYRDTTSIFTDPSIDIIVISTTPSTHFEFTKIALQSGKHCMVEKPFVPTSTQAKELLDLSRETGKLICVYQNRRWDSDFLTFRKLQREGTLGRIVEFETHFDRWKPERPENWKGQLSMAQGGGVVYDLGTHLLDQAVVAFGVPLNITAIFVNQRDGSAETSKDEKELDPDGFTIILRYKDDLIVTAKAGILSALPIQLRYSIKGTKGSYIKHNLDCQEDQLKAGVKPGDAGYGIEDERRSGVLTVVNDDGSWMERRWKNVEPEGYVKIWEGFVKAIDEGNETLVPVKVEEAVDVLRVIEKAIESARTGKTALL